MKLELGSFDRKTVLVLVGAVAVFAIVRFGFYRDSSPAEPTDSIPQAYNRLQNLRAKAATVPGKEAVLKQARAELATREAGILKADTPAQAQAQLLDIIHRLAAQNGIDARGADQLPEARPLGKDYGEVSVTETFSCKIEQLVNFLAAVANQNEMLATNNIHITGANDKQKTIQVRLTLSGVVPRKLVPVKKGSAL